ncbi:hypothetical protein QIH01_02250 [Brevibacillus brevis]|uniref:hypothetical protein n=1 Tax=Brevibacillus brevis TaxID=1393 RepID=UPI001560D0DE|nr:hypothetical protein [Brevibacillus brevis]WGV62663.1 hypothetical protein QIH01_02250 [Brevibacillus brevis]
MSQATIPDITPAISITIDQTVALLLASIAIEELALAQENVVSMIPSTSTSLSNQYD